MKGGIVFAAAASHVPYITGMPDAPQPGARDRIYSALRALGQQLGDSRADVLVTVSSDHFNNFSQACLPPFCVGLAEAYEGPVEGWIRIAPTTVRGHSDFAKAILTLGSAAGFDLAVTRDFRLEHGIIVPLSFVSPHFDIPIVPIIQNCVVPPLPSLSRCMALGNVIREAAEASELRVAVLGTGGLSHAPGAPEAGFIDEAFDRRFLALLSQGRHNELVNLPSIDVDNAGFGTWEVRQWCTALGAAAGRRANVLAYEPIVEWETGCAVAVFQL